jgi:hypothetical protein
MAEIELSVLAAPLPEKARETFRQRGAYIDPLARDYKAGCVEQEPLYRALLPQRPVQREVPVFIVPQNRAADLLQMAPYLVHAAGPQFQFQR